MLRAKKATNFVYFVGFALIAMGVAILLWCLQQPSRQPLVTRRYDDAARNHLVSSWPEYEHSIQPFFGVSGNTPFRDIATMTPPQALRFEQTYEDNIRSYDPRYQRFIRRADGTPLPPIASFQLSPSTLDPGGPGYARVGIVFSKADPDKRFPLFARPVYPGGNRFDYYVVDGTRNANPLGLDEHNGLELVTDDVVKINSLPGKYFVHIY